MTHECFVNDLAEHITVKVYNLQILLVRTWSKVADEGATRTCQVTSGPLASNKGGLHRTHLDFFCSLVLGSISHTSLVTSHSSQAVWMWITHLYPTWGLR